MLVVGLDIGGANLKAASTAGGAHTEPFAIWRAPAELPARLKSMLGQFPRPDLVAVTMTAELADCFATKSEGVSKIIGAACEAAAGIPVVVWQTNGEFGTPVQAVSHPRLVAAANWQALATWAGRLAPQGNSLLLDIGSTTTDIIPLRNGVPAARGRTDLERLVNHELLYTGISRTPLCAVAPTVPVRGRPCPVAAELFATTLDVYLLLGLIPEDPADVTTADGRAATIAGAHDRIARMVCCDRDEIDLETARSMAGAFAAAQQAQIALVIDNIASRAADPFASIVVAGSGARLARKVLCEIQASRNAHLISLADALEPELAEAACAYAVAVLAAERR